MSSGDGEAQYHTVATFLRALAILALPANRQIEWLGSLGLGEPAVCDELADEYYQQWLMLPQLVEAGLVPLQAVAHLDRLNELLGAVVNPVYHLATLEALATSDSWDQIREVAASSILLLK